MVQEKSVLPKDMLVFFDANMPKIDKCRTTNCRKKDLVFCKHRFDFDVQVVYLGKSIVGFTDFEVVKRCFKLIQKDGYQIQKPRPIFVLVTKDRNFLDDVKNGYQTFEKKGEAGIELSFGRNHGNISSGDLKIVIVIIDCKPYGSCRNHQLNYAIEKLNQLWSQARTP